jgi:thioredoxin 2
MRFDVKGIPTLMVMKGEQVLGRMTGAAPEPQLRRWLESVLPAAG